VEEITFSLHDSLLHNDITRVETEDVACDEVTLYIQQTNETIQTINIRWYSGLEKQPTNI
jgi:hypothetical protein